MTFPKHSRNSAVIERLTASIQKGRLHQAYLIEAPRSVDTEVFARDFCQAILCPQAPGTGCGTCPVCRQIAAGSHPDLTIVRKERDKKSGSKTESVRVDAVRRLTSRLQVKPAAGARSVAVIRDAGTMTPAAANCLLKTLEEPPLGAVVMLLTDNAWKMLPTIRSRCITLHLRPEEQVERGEAGERADELRQLLRERALWYRISAFITDLTRGRENGSEEIIAVLDWLEEGYRSELPAPDSAARREEIFRAVEAAEKAKTDIKQLKVNNTYALKNMALTILGGAQEEK
ncbi:MAG: hypothetical protein ACOX41_09685 [Anaerovoracaceae bacterium]|jgi:DNA polymerase-3 subunit delta'